MTIYDKKFLWQEDLVLNSICELLVTRVEMNHFVFEVNYRLATTIEPDYSFSVQTGKDSYSCGDSAGADLWGLTNTVLVGAPWAR